jgi:hypothetical protein
MRFEQYKLIFKNAVKRLKKNPITNPWREEGTSKVKH